MFIDETKFILIFLMSKVSVSVKSYFLGVIKSLHYKYEYSFIYDINFLQNYQLSSVKSPLKGVFQKKRQYRINHVFIQIMNRSHINFPRRRWFIWRTVPFSLIIFCVYVQYKLLQLHVKISLIMNWN